MPSPQRLRDLGACEAGVCRQDQTFDCQPGLLCENAGYVHACSASSSAASCARMQQLRNSSCKRAL